MARFEQAMKDAEDDLSALVGEEFTTNDEVRLVPDILQNGDQFYFPSFRVKKKWANTASTSQRSRSLFRGYPYGKE